MKKKLKVVYFFANWCHPCLIFNETFEKARSEINNVEFEKCNIEESSNKELLEDVGLVPFFKFYKNDKLIKTYSGIIEEDKFTELINKLI